MSPFPTVFFALLENFLSFKNCFLQTHSVWKSLKFIFLKRLKPVMDTSVGKSYQSTKIQTCSKLKHLQAAK